jgi:MFS transporter, ACS family, tartrate transporter
VGIVTYFYMTDWPAQAGWLPQDERDWLVHELQAELQAKKKIRNYTIVEAFCDLRIVRLIVAYFLALTGALGTIYWIPTFVKRLSGSSNQTVASLLLIAALIGIAGMLIKRLALRWDGRAALAQCYSASRCRIDVRSLDRLPSRSRKNR